METIDLARKIAAEALDGKVRDLKLLDLRGLVSYADYFILGTGTSDRHVRSAADRVHMKVKKEWGRLPLSYEGQDSGGWVLLDYGDVVLHLFLEDQRRYYALDEFWAGAPALSLAGVKPAKKASKKSSKNPADKGSAKQPAKVKAKPKARTKPPAKKKKK